MRLRSITILLLLASFLTGLTAAAGRQDPDDPQLRAAVERFFATQEAENIDAYLALWSATATKPQRDSVKYLFDSGDDKYSEITLVRVTRSGGRVRVRVSATRDRTSPPRNPGDPPRTYHLTSSWSLSYVREGDEWKLVKEGPAVDGLADRLLESKTLEEREQILADEPDLADPTLIAALGRAAGQAAQQQRYADAQIGFDRMREIANRLGEPRLEGEALQNLANAMYFQRNFEGALRAYEQRLAVERGRADDSGIVDSLLGIATVRYTFAEYGSALKTYRDALAIQERTGDEGGLASTLVSTGNIQYLQGDFAAAIADYTRSRDLYKKRQNGDGESQALRGLGRTFAAQGDYAAALDAFTAVLADAKARNHRNEQGSALMSIGDVHLTLGNLDRARASLDEARQHFEATKDLPNVGRTWLAMALTDLVAGRFVLSEDEYRKSIASCTTANEQECVAMATVGFAFAQTQQEKFTEGIASYKKGIAAFTAMKRRESAARAEIGLSRALAGSDQFLAAVDAATHARREAEAIGNDDVLWRALESEALSQRRLRERPRAMAAAESAVAAVDRLREAAATRPSVPVPRDSSSAFATLALLQAEAGDAAAAFESAERMRAHDMRVLLRAQERDISRGMTEAEREEERALAVELVSLHAQLSREKTLPKPDADRLAKLEATVAEAAQKRSAQQQRLFERLPALRFWRGLGPPATRADVATLLNDTETLLVEFVVGEESLLTITARRDADGVQFNSHVDESSRKVIATRVSEMTQPLVLQDAAAWKRAALEFSPGLSAVFGRIPRAVVIPHEILWRVPFEALPTESGYLADTTSFTYAPSVTALVKAPPSQAAAEPSTSIDLLAVAAPAVATTALDRIAQTAPGWTIRATASGDQELKAIMGAGNSEKDVRLDGAAATEAAVRDRLSAAALIHLAAPFRINGGSPMFSSMLMAPDPANDGALEAREIINLDLHARTAILSDGGAMAMRDAADQVGPVAWAWRAAGVPALVVRRWSSDDANVLLTELHTRLRAGDAPEAALHAARAKVRASADTAAPLHWASWMMVGR